MENKIMKIERKSFLSSIIAVVASSLIIIDFIVEIILQSLNTAEDITAYMKIALFSIFITVFIVTLGLSATLLRHTKDNKNITEKPFKCILISTVVFDFIAVFLLFIYIFSYENIVSLIVYIICFVLHLASGILYLIDLNKQSKEGKEQSNKEN